MPPAAGWDNKKCVIARPIYQVGGRAIQCLDLWIQSSDLIGGSGRRMTNVVFTIVDTSQPCRGGSLLLRYCLAALLHFIHTPVAG